MRRYATHKTIDTLYVIALLLVTVGFVKIRASDTHGTPLTVVAPYRWVLLNSPLESARISAACIRGGRLMALVTDRHESEIVEVSASGEIVFRRQFGGRYEDLAANSEGKWSLLKPRTAPSKPVIESFNADNIPMVPVESLATNIVYFGNDLYGREGNDFVSLKDRTRIYHVPLTEDAAVQTIAMPDGSPLFLDLLTAQFARPVDDGEQVNTTFLKAPETSAIVASRDANEASIVSASAVTADSLLALVPRFKPHEGVIALQFNTLGQIMKGYRLLLPTISAGSPTRKNLPGIMMPWFVASTREIVFIASRKPPAVAVYRVPQ